MRKRRSEERQEPPLKLPLMIVYRDQLARTGRIDYAAARVRAEALLASGVALEPPPVPTMDGRPRKPDGPRRAPPCVTCGRTRHGHGREGAECLACSRRRCCRRRCCRRPVDVDRLLAAVEAAGGRGVVERAAGLYGGAVAEVARRRKATDALVTKLAAAVGVTAEHLRGEG